LQRDAYLAFTNGGIDRAAHLRADDNALRLLLDAPKSRSMPIWRGRPLMSAQGAAWLPPAHPVFDGLLVGPLFLGMSEGCAFFAHDISGWEPPIEMLPDMGAFLDATAQTHPLIDPSLAFCDLRSAMALLSPRDAELLATAKALFGWQDSHRFCARCGQPSALTLGGWQRECGSCKAVHFPRTDPVVIMLITHGNRVLVGRSAGWPEGMYSLLAGFVEPGETIEAAVRRETLEETGIKVGPVRYLSSQPWPFPSSLMIGCVGTALTTEITVDPVEIEDAFWLTREAMADVAAGQHPRMRPPRRGAIAGHLLREWLAGRVV
jgi:NAD+ diphosphatase